MKLHLPENKKTRSIRTRLLTFLIVCWGVPIIILFVFTTYYYQKSIVDKTETMTEEELVNTASFLSIRIDDAIDVCQEPSYDRTWENAWRDYEGGTLTHNAYLQTVFANLRGKFNLDERFDLYAYYDVDQVQEETDLPECYSSRAGISYNDFTSGIWLSLREQIDSESSYPQVLLVDNRIFIVRNLYTTTRYEKFAMLVVELNKSHLFRDISQDVLDNMVVSISDMTNMDKEEMGGQREAAEQAAETELPSEQSSELQGILTAGDGSFGDTVRSLVDTLLQETSPLHYSTITKRILSGYNGYLYELKTDDYHINTILLKNRSELYKGLYQYYALIIVLLLALIPIIYYMVNFLREQIHVPMKRMIDANARVQEGEFGTTVDGGLMPNEEFEYLRESFDDMSKQVALLFDQVYDEQLAKKDAQIQALTAQINPHFLNNTLEMMNWQARMNGDVTVSKMIESLGTVLNYRMNRSEAHEIHLADELACTDAYFYIMSMRFGQRLQIEKDIDESLLYVFVPPLILQPIVENAIVHGVESVKSGVITMHIYHDEENIYIEVRNTGKKMEPEDLEKIDRILNSEDEIEKKAGRHTSIGIRNINRRVKLVYGEEYGLTIHQNDDLITISTIRLPYHRNDEAAAIMEEQHK